MCGLYTLSNTPPAQWGPCGHKACIAECHCCYSQGRQIPTGPQGWVTRTLTRLQNGPCTCSVLSVGYTLKARLPRPGFLDLFIPDSLACSTAVGAVEGLQRALPLRVQVKPNCPGFERPSSSPSAAGRPRGNGFTFQVPCPHL